MPVDFAYPQLQLRYPSCFFARCKSDESRPKSSTWELYQLEARNSPAESLAPLNGVGDALSDESVFHGCPN